MCHHACSCSLDAWPRETRLLDFQQQPVTQLIGRPCCGDRRLLSRWDGLIHGHLKNKVMEPPGDAIQSYTSVYMAVLDSEHGRQEEAVTAHDSRPRPCWAPPFINSLKSHTNCGRSMLGNFTSRTLSFYAWRGRSCDHLFPYFPNQERACCRENPPASDIYIYRRWHWETHGDTFPICMCMKQNVTQIMRDSWHHMIFHPGPGPGRPCTRGKVPCRHESCRTRQA